MKGEIYKEYGKRAEVYAEKKLLERGITKEQINKFKDSGRCLGKIGRASCRERV